MPKGSRACSQTLPSRARSSSLLTTIACLKRSVAWDDADITREIADADVATKAGEVVLKKGKTFNHKLPFWKDLEWAPGNYNFLVEADPGKKVGETNEGNNIAGAVLHK